MLRKVTGLFIFSILFTGILKASDFCKKGSGKKIDAFITPFGSVYFHPHCMFLAKGLGPDFWKTYQAKKEGCAWCSYQKDLKLEARARSWREFMNSEKFQGLQRRKKNRAAF